MRDLTSYFKTVSKTFPALYRKATFLRNTPVLSELLLLADSSIQEDETRLVVLEDGAKEWLSTLLRSLFELCTPLLLLDVKV